MRRRTLTPQQARIVDAVVILVVVATGVARELAFPAGDRRMLELPTAAYAAVQLAGGLSLWWRRSSPGRVTMINAALNVISPTQASFVAAYSLGVSGWRWRATPPFAALIAAWCLGAQLWHLEDPVTGPLLLTFAALLGLYLGTRRSLVDALVARVQHAERDRELAALSAAAEERRRLGAELHDLVTNRVTLIVLQAGALAVSSDDPSVAKGAEEIRAQGVDALKDLRGLLALVRDEQYAASGPTVDELVRSATNSGVEVRLHVDPAANADPVLARVVREALTNAVKHAPGSTVSIEIGRVGTGAVGVTVSNGPPTKQPDEVMRGAGAGSGLAALRREVRRRGGELVARDVADGGFELTATVPWEEARR